MAYFYTRAALDKEARDSVKKYRQESGDKTAKFSHWEIGFSDNNIAFLRVHMISSSNVAWRTPYFNVAI